MRHAFTALAVGTLFALTVGCAGLSTGVGFSSAPGYYPSPYGGPPAFRLTLMDMVLRSTQVPFTIRILLGSSPHIRSTPIAMVA